MSIQVNGLTKIYGEQKAVNDISFTIPKGEIVGFLGPNGAGKSTTMKMLTCYIPPSEGKALVGGFDIIKDPLKVRQKVGYLPESNPLYHEMYIREYLDFAAGLNRVANRKSKIEKLIEQTGLTPESHKKIGQLSKGYKQRVGLAQALLNEPEVLILDEPTSGLDPNQLVEIRKLIREIGKEKTVLLSTHIMQEVEQMCDRLLIIDKGQIVADKRVNSMSENSDERYWMEIRFEKPILNAQLSSLEIQERKAENHIVISGHDTKQMAKSIFEIAKSTDNVIYELKEVKRNLETMFRELTNSTSTETIEKPEE